MIKNLSRYKSALIILFISIFVIVWFFNNEVPMDAYSNEDVNTEIVEMSDIDNTIVNEIEPTDVVSEDNTDVSIEETLEENTDEAIEETLEENTDEATEETLEENTDEATEETLEENTDGVTEETLEENTDGVTEETLEENTDGVTEETLEENINGATGETLEQSAAKEDSKNIDTITENNNTLQNNGNTDTNIENNNSEQNNENIENNIANNNPEQNNENNLIAEKLSGEIQPNANFASVYNVIDFEAALSNPNISYVYVVNNIELINPINIAGEKNIVGVFNNGNYPKLSSGIGKNLRIETEGTDIYLTNIRVEKDPIADANTSGFFILGKDNSSIITDNVSFDGRAFFYSKGGKAIINDSTFKYNGPYNGNGITFLEVDEISLNGTVDIESVTNMFAFRDNPGKIIVGEEAKVTMKGLGQNAGMAFSTQGYSLELEMDSKMVFEGERFNGYMSTADYTTTDIILNEFAELYIYISGEVADYVIKADGNINVNEGAILSVVAPGSNGDLIQLDSSATIKLNNPAQVLFLNGNKPVFSVANGAKIGVEITADQINYTKSTVFSENYSILDSIASFTKYMNSDFLNSFKITGDMETPSGKLSSVNVIEGTPINIDTNEGLADNIDFSQANIVSVGSVGLDVKRIDEGANVRIVGSTDKNAHVRITVNNLKSVDIDADEYGDFIILLDKYEYGIIGDVDIKVSSSKLFLYTQKLAIEDTLDTFKMIVPANMSFPKSKISQFEKKVYLNSPFWNILVTAPEDMDWQVTATLIAPLSTKAYGGATLDLYYVDKDNNESKLPIDGSALIYTKKPTDGDEISIGLGGNGRLMTKINPNNAVIGSYTGKIEWSLSSNVE